MLDILVKRTTLGEHDLFDKYEKQYGIIKPEDNRPFDPKVWRENNYQPFGYNNEYLGPSTQEDLKKLRSHLSNTAARLKQPASLDPFAGEKNLSMGICWPSAPMAQI
ncbi:hypothetical protein JHX88_18395 [Paracoccus saliphilus]|uniref:Uncharacterized protein n=1 Tax=Paracoccus saliphilus TaxID=405559 RepID=A0ABY7S8B6_9RHOB|nr:hypothetical protein [Paracoccus saliphilus]WCR02772.1 hypothetical protein JHX88_18395 [Paracoccus saliphilus]